jgi:hypothetical protein
MQLKNNLSNEFKRWLTKKKFSYGDFSDKTRIQYNTVIGWSRGATPRKVSKILVKQKFPDCPLVKD